MAEDPNSYAARSRAAYSQVTGQLQNSSPARSSTPYYQAPVQYRPAVPAAAAPYSRNSVDMPAAPSPFSAAPDGSTSTDVQATLVAAVSHKAGQEAYLMKKVMDKPCSSAAITDANVSAVFNHCTNMLAEMVQKSEELTPKDYYEVHTKILDQMPYVEDYFLSLPSDTAGLVTLEDLYLIAQYYPKVVQRAYLHVAAGCALLKSKERVHSLVAASTSNTTASEDQPPAEDVAVLRDRVAKEILAELLDSVKGVQCPLRGLFLRHYLLQATRDKLPDKESPYGQNVEDSYNFILQNLEEMSMLWIRMQHMHGHIPDKAERKKRERERSELRILVGSNLERLSQLEGITKQVYKSVILPRILAQILKCDDTLAQAYLMDCIVQVFPDEFHMETLELFLDVLPKLKEKVNVKNIVQNVMDRLAHFRTTTISDQQLPFDAFALFDNCIRKINLEKGDKIGLKEIIRLQTTLLEFSLNCYPDNLDHVNQCLEDSAKALSSKSSAQISEPAVAEQLELLLTVPVKTLGLKVLNLNRYADLLSYVSLENRKQVSLSILRMVGGTATAPLLDVDRVEQLYSILSPVIREEVPTGADSSEEVEEKLDEHSEEQELVARLVHMLQSDDTDTLFKMYAVARKHLSQGGKSNLHHTLTPLVFRVILLIYRVHNLEFPPLDVPENNAQKVNEEKIDALPEKQEDLSTATIKQVIADNIEESKPTDAAEMTNITESTTPDEQLHVEDSPPVPEEKPESTSSSNILAVDLFTVLPAESERTFRKVINCRKLFVFLQKIIATLAPHYPELSFKLYLEAAMAADKCAMWKANSGHGTNSKSSKKTAPEVYDSLFKEPTSGDIGSIAYEFISQAFSIYDDEMNDSKVQFRSISSLINCLLSCNMFDKGDYESLITKTAQCGARLLKKPDQCKIIMLCSHLFYRNDASDEVSKDKSSSYRNPQRVLECLQRSLKIADACMASSSNLQLFIDILEEYIYFFEKQNPAITDTFVSGLIALINELIDSMRDYSDATIQAQTHYRHILHYIAKKKQSEGEMGRFRSIVT